MFVSMKDIIETWRPVVGYEGLYEVSDQGRVRSLKRNTTNGKILIPIKNKSCYLNVHLSIDGISRLFRLHRLVAFAFPEICGEYFEGAVCNHKNENKLDNRAENLEWCTPKYNTNWGTGLKRMAQKLSKSVAQYTIDGVLIAIYSSTAEAARQTGYSQSHICKCCQGKQQIAYGYVWRYV